MQRGESMDKARKEMLAEASSNYTESIFESIKHVNEYGVEFWYARELQTALEYKQWRRFENIINKAKDACQNSGNDVSDHFANVGKMVDIGSGATRTLEDYELSRYACYLIVQNGDSRKKVIALGQTYFAVKTRQQELAEKFEDLSEDKKRLEIRGELAVHNKSLAETARMAGIEKPKDYAIFQNRGYQGLYGGLGVKEIHERKGLKKSQKILDHMGSTELAANLFRATQTNEKLKREHIAGKNEANQIHFEVGKKVRERLKILAERCRKIFRRQTKVSYRLKKNMLNWKIQKWKYDKRENAKGISYNSFAFSLK